MNPDDRARAIVLGAERRVANLCAQLDEAVHDNPHMVAAWNAAEAAAESGDEARCLAAQAQMTATRDRLADDDVAVRLLLGQLATAQRELKSASEELSPLFEAP